MPIRFLCTECHKLLSVSMRKIGSEVKCPKCQATIVVPAAEEAAATLAFAKATHLPSREQEPISEYVGFDDLDPDLAGPTLTSPPPESPPAPAADSDLITFARRMLYWQAICLGIVMLISFGLGYLWGRMSRTGSSSEPSHRAQAEAPLN